LTPLKLYYPDHLTVRLLAKISGLFFSPSRFSGFFCIDGTSKTPFFLNKQNQFWRGNPKSLSQNDPLFFPVPFSFSHLFYVQSAGFF